MRLARAGQFNSPITVEIVNAPHGNETIACGGGVSPCTIGAASTAVLNANTAGGRHAAVLQNLGITVFCCKTGTGTPVAFIACDYILKADTAANTGNGGSFSYSGPTVWSGVVTCISSAAGGSLAVFAY